MAISYVSFGHLHLPRNWHISGRLSNLQAELFIIVFYLNIYRVCSDGLSLFW